MAIVLDRQHFLDRHIYTVNLYETNITVTVTSVGSVVERWLRDTLYLSRYFYSRNRLIVGLGVQWTSSGQIFSTDTVQLCVGRRCLIFHLSHAQFVPMLLRRFLTNPSITFVGFWNDDDRLQLQRPPHGIEMCRDPLDLRFHLVTKHTESLAHAEVDEIVEEILGYKVEQRSEINMSNWREENLSDDQVVYACVDAHCAFLIGRIIRAWKEIR